MTWPVGFGQHVVRSGETDRPKHSATVDVSIDRYGKDIWADWWPDSHYRSQFDYGEKIGIGTTDYELVSI